MATFCLNCETKKESKIKSTAGLKCRINVSHDIRSKLSFVGNIIPKVSKSVLIVSKNEAKANVLPKTKLNANLISKNIGIGAIRSKTKCSLSLSSKNTSVSSFKNVKVDKFGGNTEKIKGLNGFLSTQKLFPIRDIVTSLNNSYFVDKNLNSTNLYSNIDEGVYVGDYVTPTRNGSIISDERQSYIQPSSIITKGDFRYKFEVTRPNSIEESFLFIRAAAPVSNYSSDIPPQYRLHNIKLEDPSGNLIIKYKDIIIRGDADYNTDYVNFATYISEPEINNLKLNTWDTNFPLMNEPSGYTLNIDFAIDCLDDPFSQGFDKGYEDTCKLDFVNSSNNSYLSFDGSPLSTQVQNFSLNPTNSIRISAIEIANSGGDGAINSNYLRFYTEVNAIGNRLIRNILPVEVITSDTDLGIYPQSQGVWESSLDDLGNFARNTSVSGSRILTAKLQDTTPLNYIKLVYTDPENDSGRLSLRFSHKPPETVDSLSDGYFSPSFNDSYKAAALKAVQAQDNFFIVDEISLKVIAKKSPGTRDYALDIVGWSDDKILNITPKIGAFLQNKYENLILGDENENAVVSELEEYIEVTSQTGSVPEISGNKPINDLGISTETFSNKSQYFKDYITNVEAGDHYQLSIYPIIDSTTFKEYIIPLSIYKDNVELGLATDYSISSYFENLYLDIYNLPSGAAISSAQLIIKYKPSNAIMMHTLGRPSLQDMAIRDLVLKPSAKKLLDPVFDNASGSYITNIPNAFSLESKTNYARRWRSVDGNIVYGPYNPNEFDFSFFNPEADQPFLNGYYDFTNISGNFVISDNYSNSGYFSNSLNVLKNIGWRFKDEQLFANTTNYTTIDWTQVGDPLHEKITDSFDSAILVGGNSGTLSFNNTSFSSGAALYVRFSPNYDYNNDAQNTIVSKDSSFALYIDNSTEQLVLSVGASSFDDLLDVTSVNYPLSLLLTYDSNEPRINLYHKNEISNTNDLLISLNQSLPTSTSDLVFGDSNYDNALFIHEIGISTSGNIVSSNPNRLLKQTTVNSFLNNDLYSYVDENVSLWKIGDFNTCAFSPDFDHLLRREGKDYIFHSLTHDGRPYSEIINLPLPSNIYASGLAYHTQIENDFLRFYLSDIQDDDDTSRFHSVVPRISKTIPRGYNFIEDALVVDSVITHSTYNDISWPDGKIGPKLIVSLYTKNKEPVDRPSKTNWGLINRAIHYLQPSGCVQKISSKFTYNDLIDTSEPWASFDSETYITEFNEKFYSKDIDDMFLQYDLVYPSGQAFKSKIRIDSINVGIKAIVKELNENNTINLISSGELKALSSLDLHTKGFDFVVDSLNMFSSGQAVPLVSGTLSFYSFGAYVDDNNIPLYCHNLGSDNKALFTYIAGRTDKFAENNLVLFTQNLAIDQSAFNTITLSTINKLSIEYSDNNLNFFINSILPRQNTHPSGTTNLFINAFNKDPFSINSSLPLYLNGIPVAEFVASGLSLYTINYPANPLLNKQETISWNSENVGKDITTLDNQESYLDANDEIRGVDLDCFGECGTENNCVEDIVESHSILYSPPESCVDGGIFRPQNTYTNLETSGFRTEVGYSGHFYGIRKYDNLLPQSPYSIVIEAQTGSNRPIELPFEFTEVEYGSNDYVGYSGISLLNNEIQPTDEYGKCGDIKNDLMVVGAPKHDLVYYEYDESNNLTSGILEDAGAVFVYRREARPSGSTWPVDKHKSPWTLETKLTLPSGILKDYFVPRYTNTIGNISLPLPITERLWQVGQEGREFGHSVAIGVNSGIKSFEENQREIIVVGGPNSKWTPRPFEELQTSGVQVGLLIFTDEFTPNVIRRPPTGQPYVDNYTSIISKIQNKDLIFKYFSDPPVSFDVKIIICEPLSDYSNRIPLESPQTDFITKRTISRNQGFITAERNEKILSGIKEAFHSAFPYDPTKINNNIPAMLGIYVDNTRSMRNAIDGQVSSLNNFINYYQNYSFASGLRDFYNTPSSGAVVRHVSAPSHWIDAANSMLDYVLDTGRLLQDNQVRFFTSGVGQDAFNENLSQFNYPPDSGGKVFIFEKESGYWNLVQEIKSSNITYSHPDRFGHAVAISDNTEVIAIGSPYISDSCQIFEYKQSEKDRVFNEISSWVAHKSSITGGVGRYATLISDYYSWVAKYGYDYSNKILYSKLTSTEKFEARKYLNIQEYKQVLSYNQGNFVGKSKWNFIIDEFAPTARLGYSAAVNDDGSIVAFGAPTDSLNQWDDARVYYKNLGYLNTEDTSLNTNIITPAWRSNVNAGAVRIFESRKYYPHNKVIEYGKFGNLQKELGLPEDSGHFNYLPTIFQDKNFEVTPFSQVNIPQDAGLAFIITPSVDALSNEVLDNIVEWLSLGDRNLVLVGNDPTWESSGVYSESNEIVNKILEELDSRMKLFPARNQLEACLDNESLGIPTFVDNSTPTYISKTNVNIHGVADIRTNFDNIPLLKDKIIYSSCSSENVDLGNEVVVALPTANTKCELPIKNAGDLRAQWYKYCIGCGGRREKYAVNIPFYFSTFTPLCNCDEEETKKSLASSRVNGKNQEPVPILAAAKKQVETIVIPSSGPVYGTRPTYSTETYTSNSSFITFDENNVGESASFTWSIDDQVDIEYLIGSNNIIQPQSQDGTSGILQILASPFSEQTFGKKEVSDKGYFCVEQSLYNSKIIGIAGLFTESESVLYNAGLDKSFANDENINFYVNMVSKSSDGGSRIKFLSSQWVGRSSFTDAYPDSQLHGVFLDNGNFVEYSDTIYSYDDVCWIANPKNIPNDIELTAIKSWLSIGNKKLIVTHDSSIEQMNIANSLFDLLGSDIESLYLPVDDVYARIRLNQENYIRLNLNHPISIGYNDAITSIQQINFTGLNSIEFISFKLNNNIIPIAYYGGPVYDTEIITNGYWSINSQAKVSFPAIAGSGYKIFINTKSDNEYESQAFNISTQNVSISPKIPYPTFPIDIYQDFTSTRSVSFNAQVKENKNTIDFYITSYVQRISNVDGYIPKTPKLISISGVPIGIKENITTSTYSVNVQTGYENYLISNGEPERIVTREFFDFIKNKNTQYCQEDCLDSGFDDQLIADGPVIVAQEQEHITSFNAGYNRSRITLIADSSLVQGRYLGDDQGRIPLSTLNFISSLYPQTNFASANAGRQFNQQTKIVAPERGSPQKYLSLISNSGLSNKFAGSIPSKQPTLFNSIESHYDPRYVIYPLDPWDISDDEISIESKKNAARQAFMLQETNFGAKSKFTEVVDGTLYKDINIYGGLPQLLKDKGYDHIDFNKLPSGYPGDLFGYSIALHNNKLIVGAPFAAFSDETINPWQQYIDGGSSSGIELSYNGGAGSVFIFEKTFNGSGLHGTLTPWEFVQKLRPSSVNIGQDIYDGNGSGILGTHNYGSGYLANNSIITDKFGLSVDIDSDIIVVGAPGHDFDNKHINTSGSFIRKEFNEEFYIPQRIVTDLGSSGIRLQNSGTALLNNGSIFTFENKIIDWSTKDKKWTFIEKIVPVSGCDNQNFGSTVSIDRLFRTDADYTVFAGSNSGIYSSGSSYSYDIMLRQPPPSIPSPDAFIQAKVFGERDSAGNPNVFISIQNSGENNQKYFASGTIFSDNKGQIFIEVSGQDPATKGFIAHRPFIKSIDGQYTFGTPNNGNITLYTNGSNFINQNLDLFTGVDDKAIVYNSLGLYNSAIIDFATNLPSGFILYTNCPDPVEINNSGLTLYASGIGSQSDKLNLRIRGKA